MAESLQAPDALINLSAAFDRTTLTARQQQVVALTVSTLSGCQYCEAVHTGLGRMAGAVANDEFIAMAEGMAVV